MPDQTSPDQSPFNSNSTAQPVENSLNETMNQNTGRTDAAHTRQLSEFQMKRGAKDYLFEFFMLFLAITAGFFMENMREAYVDNQKEKQYISGLLHDLQQDTTDLREILESDRHQRKGIDSLLLLLENPKQQDFAKKFYYYSNKYLSSYVAFSVREITIIQLRNSGGFRLIENTAVSDSIIDYYSTYDSQVEQHKFNFRLVQDLLELQVKYLDFSTYRLKKGKYPIGTLSMKEYYNRILIFDAMLRNEIDTLEEFYAKSVSLMDLLKKEYKMN